MVSLTASQQARRSQRKGRPEPFTAETAEPAEPLNVLFALGGLGGEGLWDTPHATAFFMPWGGSPISSSAWSASSARAGLQTPRMTYSRNPVEPFLP